MIDLDIRYPGAIDILPVTTTVSINIGENINALRDSVLNMQTVLGTNVNIGLFTPNPEDATVSDRLNRLERGIAERNLVFREINVSDALSVLLDPNNRPSVRIGSGLLSAIAPVTILGPLTIIAPAVAQPMTVVMTPVTIDVSTLPLTASPSSTVKGKSNPNQPLLIIQDINATTYVADTNSYAMVVQGNVKVTGQLIAEYSIDHTKLLNIETVPTDATRGSTRHVTQGDYHTHRKGRYDSTNARWIVDSSTDIIDTGIIKHNDLEGIGTLPTHGNDFAPLPKTAYHVTGGDLHAHKVGDGAQIDHNDLKNTNPKFSNHVTSGDAHDHTNGRGAQIDHATMKNIGTNGPTDIHVPLGGNHAHKKDDAGNAIGDGATIDHAHLDNIETVGAGALHVTNGDNHTHGIAGDGAKVDHETLANIGELSHVEIDTKIATFRAIKTGTAQFTASGNGYNQVTVNHTLGTDQFNLAWGISGLNNVPPSSPFDVGVIYVSDKTTTSFTLKRLFSSSSVFRIYDSGIVSASSLGPTIAHALGSTPMSLELLHQVNTKWEFLDVVSYLTSDGTNIYTQLAVLGSDQVRIIASVTTTSSAAQPGPAIKAQVITALPTANSNLYYIAKAPGSTGNNISIQYEQNSSITTNPFVVASTSSIVVFFNTPVTANEVRLGILSNVTASSLVDVITASGSNGSGNISALGQFFLTGGADTSGISALDLEWTMIAKGS